MRKGETMRATRIGLLVLAVTVSGSMVSTGAVYIEDWNGAVVEGWQIGTFTGGYTGSLASPTLTPGAGGTNSALSANFTAPDTPDFRVDRIYAEGAGASGGNFTTVDPNYAGETISFDYYGTAIPGGFGLYFVGNGGSAAVWFYNLDTFGPISTWNSSPTISFAGPTGWSLLGGLSTDFATDIQSVLEIGVRLDWPVNGAYTYNIDNFSRADAPLGGGYAVPEPGTFAALGFAFASMGLTFRRRLNDAVAKVKGMFKA